MKQHPNANRQVRHNVDVHDSATTSYENTHTEIYNPTEQKRIAQALQDAISLIATGSEIPLVLDFGAGIGNLTGHMLKVGARVLAADVSARSLSSLKARYCDKVDTIDLNGIDLSNLKDNSVDMVATYSVLHHVPDYLGIVKEFVRVVKPGGIIYIDHESAPSVWREDCKEYNGYRNELKKAQRQPFTASLLRKVGLLLSYKAWRRLVNRKIYGLNPEGDIHVFKEDHVEWHRIESILLDQCVLITKKDYLVCREVAPLPLIYTKYKDACVDMRLLICKKQ